MQYPRTRFFSFRLRELSAGFKQLFPNWNPNFNRPELVRDVATSGLNAIRATTWAPVTAAGRSAKYSKGTRLAEGMNDWTINATLSVVKTLNNKFNLIP
jgi:hypothetical protein